MSKFKLGDRVRKTSGSNWCGIVVGTYSTTLTPEGYAVESDTEKGSVQIYPAKALELAPPTHEWQGLTLEQKHQLNDALNLQGRFAVIDAIETKCKENNT